MQLQRNACAAHVFHCCMAVLGNAANSHVSTEKGSRTKKLLIFEIVDVCFSSSNDVAIYLFIDCRGFVVVGLSVLAV